MLYIYYYEKKLMTESKVTHIYIYMQMSMCFPCRYLIFFN